MSNTAKFSVGFGLLFFAIIKMVVLFSVEMMMAAPHDDDDDDFEMTAQPTMPTETPSRIAPENAKASIVFYGTAFGNGQEESSTPDDNFCRMKRAVTKARNFQSFIHVSVHNKWP
jgi:hypothetical protein